MTNKTALFALLCMWGIGSGAVPALSQGTTAAESEEEVAESQELRFTDRVWVRADADSGLPGPMQVFLSDGTLVTDSCWETYRLSAWTQVGERTLRWSEDGMEIGAEIVSMTAIELVLRLDVGGGMVQRFVAAEVPYVCPDMER